MDYGDLYAELKNKIRWSIASSLNEQEITVPYRESERLAAKIAGELLEEYKIRVNGLRLDLKHRIESETRALAEQDSYEGSPNGTS